MKINGRLNIKKKPRPRVIATPDLIRGKQSPD